MTPSKKGEYKSSFMGIRILFSSSGVGALDIKCTLLRLLSIAKGVCSLPSPIENTAEAARESNTFACDTRSGLPYKSGVPR